MRANLVLLFLPSILLGSSSAKSLALNSLVEEFSHTSLNWLVSGSRLREKRQKDSDLNPSRATEASVGHVGSEARQRFVPTQMPMGEDGGAHCLVRCLRPMINKAPQDAGNETLICPKYDARRIEELCGGYLQAKRCLDECPESPLKNLSMSGFKPLQFMCVDRSEDFKKYMPCLTSVCDEVQKQCEPTCGSLDESVRRLARIQQQVRGPGSRSRGADLDVPEILQTVADNCQLVGCVGNCSREPMTRKCGAAAYDLQRDTIWTMLSSMAQAMSSIGLNSVWPPQCQALLAADKLRHAKTEGTSSQKEEDQGPNSTDRFVDKQTDRASNNTTAIHTGPAPEVHTEPEAASHTATATSAPPANSAASLFTCTSAALISSTILFKVLRSTV